MKEINNESETKENTSKFQSTLVKFQKPEDLYIREDDNASISSRASVKSKKSKKDKIGPDIPDTLEECFLQV